MFADSYAPQGVLVNAVTPGAVGTGLWRDDVQRGASTVTGAAWSTDGGTVATIV